MARFTNEDPKLGMKSGVQFSLPLVALTTSAMLT